MITDDNRASRFKATKRLLEMAVAEGITSTNVDEHFKPRLPQNPISLRAASYWSSEGKIDGEYLPVPETAHTRKLMAQVEALNEFLDRFVITGGSFEGYTRKFNEGDHKDFDWNKGGRLYGEFDKKRNYQLLSGEERLRMTIGGEPVAEIDISASYLTLLHGLQGLPLDTSRDLYQVEGYSREVVKTWATVTLGNRRHFDKWPEEAAHRFKEKHNQDLDEVAPIADLRSAMEEKYPMLEQWSEQKLTWADLMFAESEIIIGTMMALMEKDKPSFCIHDSILVRRSDVELARQLLSDNYQAICGLHPRLSVTYSEGG
jgi:hypothetical protein